MNRSIRRPVLACLLLFLLSTPAWSTLIAYYPLDGSPNEATGNNIDLIEFGDVQYADSVHSGLGQALDLDGVDDYLAGEDFQPADTNDLTISAWVFDASEGAPAVWASIVKHWGHALTGQFHFGLKAGNGTLNNFISQANGAIIDVEDSEVFPSGEWIHTAAVVDSSSRTQTLYRNGERVATARYNGTLGIGQGANGLGIGVKPNDAGSEADPTCCPGYWWGRLDEIAIWDEPKSGDEIKTIYNNGLMGIPIGSSGPPGDFDRDGLLTAADMDLLSAEVSAGTNTPRFDLNNDAVVDRKDRTVWVEQLKRTYFGDANLDGEFNSGDFVQVFQRGEYEDTTAGNSTWEDGDWDGDGEFDSTDFVVAFQGGGFEQGPRAGAAAVPEPQVLLLLLPTSIFVFVLRRQRR